MAFVCRRNTHEQQPRCGRLLPESRGRGEGDARLPVNLGLHALQPGPCVPSPGVSYPVMELSIPLICSNLEEAKSAYNQSLRLDPTNHTAHSSLGWIAIHQDQIRAAIRILHTALSLAPQDPMATVLLEIALKEQVERFGPTTIPGLPAALSAPDFDPFNVPKVSPLVDRIEKCGV